VKNQNLLSLANDAQFTGTPGQDDDGNVYSVSGRDIISLSYTGPPKYVCSNCLQYSNDKEEWPLFIFFSSDGKTSYIISVTTIFYIDTSTWMVQKKVNMTDFFGDFPWFHSYTLKYCQLDRNTMLVYCFAPLEESGVNPYLVVFNLLTGKPDPDRNQISMNIPLLSNPFFFSEDPRGYDAFLGCSLDEDHGLYSCLVKHYYNIYPVFSITQVFVHFYTESRTWIVGKNFTTSSPQFFTTYYGTI